MAISENVSQKTHRKSTLCSRETTVSVLFFIASFLFWGVRYGDFLYAIQDNSLFLPRADYFRNWLDEPGGLLFYLTAFIIQFGRFPLVGGTVLALTGTLLQVVTAKTLNLRNVGYVASFLPVSFLAISATWRSYYVYNPFNNSLVFSGYLGALVALGVLAVYRKIPSYGGRVIFLVLTGVGAYFPFGFWALWGVFLCAINEGTRNDVKLQKKFTRVGAVLLLALAAPYFDYFVFLFSRMERSDVFLAGLLDSAKGSSDVLTSCVVTWGAVAAPAVLAILLAVSRFFENREKTSRQQKKNILFNKALKTDVSEAERLKRQTRLLWELFVVVAATTFLGAYRADPFFQTLAQNRAVLEGDWQKILAIDAKLDKPIEHNVALRNVALFETGELAERVFERPIAGLNALDLTLKDFERASKGDAWARWKVWLFQKRRLTQSAALNTTSEAILCRYGQSNVAARCAMNKFIGCEGRSVSCLRTLAICAEINGEKKLAKRYLRELTQTFFWKRWAELRLAYLESSNFQNNVRNYLDDPANGEKNKNDESLLSTEEAASLWGLDARAIVALDENVQKARKLRPNKNRKQLDVFPDLARLYAVFTDEFDKTSVEVQELELIASLFQKGAFEKANDEFFLKNVGKYLESKGKNAPKAIDEGYATLRYKKFGDAWNKIDYRFLPSTEEGFGEFVDFARKRNGDLDSFDSQAAVRACCQGTYWGYCFDNSAFMQF